MCLKGLQFLDLTLTMNYFIVLNETVFVILFHHCGGGSLRYTACSAVMHPVLYIMVLALILQ